MRVYLDVQTLVIPSRQGCTIYVTQPRPRFGFIPQRTIITISGDLPEFSMKTWRPVKGLIAAHQHIARYYAPQE